MSMPGFTANASLYKTKGRWTTVSTQAAGPGTPRILPQLSFNPFPGSTSAGLFGGLREVGFVDSCAMPPGARAWIPAKAPGIIRNHRSIASFAINSILNV